MNAEKSPAEVDQSNPERAQRERRDSLKCYTPEIRYTKLEFKVISSLFYFWMLTLGILLKTAVYNDLWKCGLL